MRGAVASGHPVTTGAACRVLKRGGNAFDAALAGAFAATVAEPCLTSLGGGGFLLSHEAGSGASHIYDFFVNSPGLGREEGTEPHFEPVEVEFTGTVQIFHVGMGSVAVPGMLRGLMEFYDDLCTMGMDDIVAPAIDSLRQGVEANGLQQYLSRILKPIMGFEDYGRSVYDGSECEGAILRNPLYLEFLEKRDPSAWLDAFYGSGADTLGSAMEAGGGLLTARDLKQYYTVKREPMRFGYRGRDVVTNGPPSFGGELLGAAFGWLSGRDVPSMDDTDAAVALVRAMEVMNEQRLMAGGTTHISVIDSAGNAASMTSSNGSNSGCFVPGTGVMLNNMMGEDDLHPGGFHAMPAGIRVGSMMSPSMIMQDGRVQAALGSGGSKRIRTAMLQVIHNMLDRGMAVREAVERPRMHLDDDCMLQMEPGLGADIAEAVACECSVNQWGAKDMYFGGVHVATSDLSGWGDSRRGGFFKAV